MDVCDLFNAKPFRKFPVACTFIISALISALDNLLVPILRFGGRTENFRFLFRPVKSSGFSPADNLMS